jgi:magnesium chelatase subunit D
VRRYKSQPRATTVFVVDASGSAALNRLAEAKGAVELMLGECYIRRDQVALLAFRGTTAELLLPPTGALARARRCLGSLPGGGGTPLAAGMEAASALAETLRRQGETPKLVLLTDGRANVALDGVMDRSRAMADAERVARRLRASGLPVLVIDISPRPQPEAARIAAAMGARCLALPRADAAALNRAVRAAA